MSGVIIHGPYQRRNRWRLIIKEGRRTIASKSYPTRKAAQEAKTGYTELTRADDLWAEAARLEEQAAIVRAKAEAASSKPTTVGDLIDQYVQYVMYLRDHKQRKPDTVKTTRYQLNAILEPVRDMPARGLTRSRAGIAVSPTGERWMRGGDPSRRSTPGTSAVAMGGQETHCAARTVGRHRADRYTIRGQGAAPSGGSQARLSSSANTGSVTTNQGQTTSQSTSRRSGCALSTRSRHEVRRGCGIVAMGSR